MALANFLFARKFGGRFLLRFDDTDLERSTPEYAASIEQDLAWLGIAWDSVLHQSDRRERYEAAATRLREAGRLYPCFESEEELRAKREARIKRGRPPVYDRAMLHLTERSARRLKQAGNGLTGGSGALRRDRVMARSRAGPPAGQAAVGFGSGSDPRRWHAALRLHLGRGRYRDRHHPYYSRRGSRHQYRRAARLFSALGAAPSRFAFGHLPLLTDVDGSKLSKRLAALSLRSLRQDGVEPRAIAAYLARLGSSDDPQPVAMEELIEHFDLSHFSRSSARFDMRQLLALNRRVLHGLGLWRVAARPPSGATEAFWLAVRGNLDLLSEARGWWEVIAGTSSRP